MIVTALATEPLDAAIVPGAADTVLRLALGGPGVAVAVKVIGFDDTPSDCTVAVSVLLPSDWPRVQLPTVAMPSAPVVASAPVDGAPARGDGERHGHIRDRRAARVPHQHRGCGLHLRLDGRT